MLGYPLGSDTPPLDQSAPPGSRHPPDQSPPPQEQTPRHRACWEIRSTRGRYASCWNATFLNNVRQALSFLLVSKFWYFNFSSLTNIFLFLPSGPPKEICIYSAASWTILLPVTICVTVVSILLASGWSTYVTYALKTVTSCGCCGNDSDSGDAFPGFFESLQNNNKISGNNMSKNVDDAVETNNKKIEEMSISVQLVMFFIVLLGLIMFIVLIVYGNLYSDTSQIVRAQMAITLTSLFQMVVFHCLQDSASSTRTFSVNSGDVVSV